MAHKSTGVVVVEGRVDSAMRKLRRMMREEKTINLMKDRQVFKKPSVGHSAGDKVPFYKAVPKGGR